MRRKLYKPLKLVKVTEKSHKYFRKVRMATGMPVNEQVDELIYIKRYVIKHKLIPGIKGVEEEGLVPKADRKNKTALGHTCDYSKEDYCTVCGKIKSPSDQTGAKDTQR